MSSLRNVRYILIIILLTTMPVQLVSQRVKHLPKWLGDPYVRIDFKNIHDNKCGETDAPWVIYSIQEPDFGQRYFVTGESKDSLFIYNAMGLDGFKLITPIDNGLLGKSKLLIHVAAEFKNRGNIHKKCLSINPYESWLLDSIAKGIIQESEISVYNSPYISSPIGNLPFFYIFYIYKSENGRVLLERNFKFQPGLPFSEQIIGWVDKSRVLEINTSLFIEPNYEKENVAFRICHPEYFVKTFWSQNIILPKIQTTS